MASNRVTQKEIVNRLYKKEKDKWNSTNIEEKTTGNSIYKNGVLHEETSRGFIPYYLVKRFDSNVSIKATLARRVKGGDIELIKSVLTEKERMRFICDQVTKALT